MAEESYQPSSSSVTEERTNRDSIKKGFEDFKRFATTNFTRAVQYVTEKTGKAEVVTEYDTEFETLCSQLDLIKSATEKMVAYVETIAEPNPNIRWETWARQKIDKPRPDPPSGHSLLSNELTKVGTSFGPDTQYGAYLLRCSDVEGKLAQSQKQFKDTVGSDFLIPLRAFLEVDIKAILRERKVLSVLKLDLDAALSRTRKAQSDDKVQAAEEELRSIQAEYDSQLEKTRTSLKRIVETHINHMGYMRKFMAAQKAYYSECQAHLESLEGGGFSYSTATPSLKTSDEPSSKVTVGGVLVDPEEAYKGKMLYDYDAQNEGEMTINSGEVLVVYPIPGDEDYVMGDYNGKQGKLLSTYIEKL